MKKIALFLTVIFITVSCKNNGEYTINGTIDGMKTGTVYLEKQSDTGMGMIPIDTVKVVDGKFEITGKTVEPTIHFIQIDSLPGKVPFVLEGGNITIKVDKDSIFKSKMSGTYSNDEFYNFNNEIGKLQKKAQSQTRKFQMDNMAKMNEAQKNNDTVTMNALRKQYNILLEESKPDQEKVTNLLKDYPKSHPKSYISLLIVESMINNPQSDVLDIEKQFNSLDSQLKNTNKGKKIVVELDLKKKEVKESKKAKQTSSNNVAPNFEGKTPEGKKVSLKESMGKVTVIDFWASWCKPCRQENPNVVAMYNEFHSKGLNIIGVSLDDNLDNWKNAISKDKITWTQVSNLQGWKDPIAIQYNITQIPATIVLDANGVIVARDLRGEQLKAKVAELLVKK